MRYKRPTLNTIILRFAEKDGHNSKLIRFLSAALKVGIESKEGVPSPPPNQNQIPDLSEPVYFIGGLSPGFKTPIQLPRSFLGCMSNIQINQEGYNPLRGRYSGVNARCSDKVLLIL